MTDLREDMEGVIQALLQAVGAKLKAVSGALKGKQTFCGQSADDWRFLHAAMKQCLKNAKKEINI